MSTASYVHRYSVLANSQLAYGMSFNNDGTKTYYNPYGTSDDIDEYILSTAFDVSSASYSQDMWESRSFAYRCHLIMMEQKGV